MVAMLIGCGLRRAEPLVLRLESILQREERWVMADLVGKAGHVRTVPIPSWVKTAVDAWTAAAGITDGRVFRAISKAGRVWGDEMSPKVLWDDVRAAAARAGIDKLARHDLRRTCARLCHLASGELDQTATDASDVSKLSKLTARPPTVRGVGWAVDRSDDMLERAGLHQ
jgi:integrase